MCVWALACFVPLSRLKTAGFRVFLAAVGRFKSEFEALYPCFGQNGGTKLYFFANSAQLCSWMAGFPLKKQARRRITQKEK